MGKYDYYKATVNNIKYHLLDYEPEIIKEIREAQVQDNELYEKIYKEMRYEFGVTGDNEFHNTYYDSIYDEDNELSFKDMIAGNEDLVVSAYRFCKNTSALETKGFFFDEATMDSAIRISILCGCIETAVKELKVDLKDTNGNPIITNEKIIRAVFEKLSMDDFVDLGNDMIASEIDVPFIYRMEDFDDAFESYPPMVVLKTCDTIDFDSNDEYFWFKPKEKTPYSFNNTYDISMYIDGRILCDYIRKHGKIDGNVITVECRTAIGNILIPIENEC